MSFLNKIFRGSGEPKEEKVLPWIALNDIQQMQYIIEKSKVKPQAIFKHSTRCGISRMVMNQFISMYSITENDLDLYYLDLINYPAISDEIGIQFMIMHESPQLIVIKNGNAVAYASYGGVNNIALQEYI